MPEIDGQLKKLKEKFNTVINSNNIKELLTYYNELLELRKNISENDENMKEVNMALNAIWHVITKIESNNVEDKTKKTAKAMTLPQLIKGSMQPFFTAIYQEEMTKRINQYNKEIRRLEKDSDAPKKYSSLINFDEIIKIINICQKNDINDAIDGKDNNDKLFRITVKKVIGGVSIAIICNDERGLKIDFATFGVENNDRFMATLTFHYYYYPTENIISFVATTNNYHYDFQTKTGIQALHESTTPITPEGRVVLWNQVGKCKNFMFEQSELQFVINMLNESIQKGTTSKKNI